MSSLDKAINMLFFLLIFVILSSIFDLYDILTNGLSFNNNANKALMFLFIFSAFVLIFTGKDNHQKFSHYITVFGLLLIFFAFADLLINSILDFKKLNFSLIILIKPIGYSIGIILSFLLIYNIRNN